MASPVGPHDRPLDTKIRIIGGAHTRLRDLYHAFLVLPWWVALLALVVVYLALNAGFACAYLVTGGVEHARAHSFADAFFFSIQTMGTIGYGAMYPVGAFANVLVVTESVTGLIVTALATGLVFAKFSQSNARVVFTATAVITPMNGVPTLMFRVGNQRPNRILEAILRLVILRTERTKEGMLFYRMYDVPLTRDRSPALARSWTAMHVIDEKSPLFRMTPDTLRALEAELIATLVGVDDTSLQPVHARKTYEESEILWGARHADIITEEKDGSLTLDLRKFHETVPTEPIDGFPYPALAPGPPSRVP